MASSSFVIERVTHSSDHDRGDECVYFPQITTLKAPRPPDASGAASNPFDADNGRGDQSSSEETKDFRAGDVSRVLDFDNLDTPPSDTQILLNLGNGFNERYVCLRGSYLFFFRSDETDTSRYEPLGCVPLSRTVIEFPPGGRRVFQQHAGIRGYEFVIRHTGDQFSSVLREDVYFVVNSLGDREDWANAISLRSEIRKDTSLKPGTVGDADAAITGNIIARDLKTHRKFKKSTYGMMEENSGLPSSQNVTEDPMLQEALGVFGKQNFSTEQFVSEFYQTHKDYDAPGECRRLEEFQVAVKQGLRGAVLEQYEYFVEATREMTTMGKEVSGVRTLVEGQLHLINQLKSIEFASNFSHHMDGDSSSDEEDDDEALEDASLSSEESSQSSEDGFDDNLFMIPSSKHRQSSSIMKFDEATSVTEEDPFEVPLWLHDVTEEVSAFIKESRYTDATDLILKAKSEIEGILAQHENKLTEKSLTKKQYSQITQISDIILEKTKSLSERLTESLRRKNEALRQLIKRERADPLSELAPLLSPICLQDDGPALDLLVKLGFHNDAATAYAARRSLLLNECLSEKPLSGEGKLDVVINASQLSKTFFTCLSVAVEGFLDLFSGSSGSEDEINTILTTPHRVVMPSALSAIVLWVDSEIVKFANTFGGNRILGKLPLTPLAQTKSDGSILKNMRELEEYQHGMDLRDTLHGTTKKSSGFRDRKMTIKTAAKCVDQAFQFASENLDTIGLPVTPRLSECLRGKLKGCESEIAMHLRKWNPYVFDWMNSNTTADSSMKKQSSTRLMEPM